jgi:L-2-hydroxyglutarate oxidase LhgO
MKKIIASLMLLLAFSMNVSAQETKGYIGLNATEKGKKQAAELSEYLGLDATMNQNFAMLFEQKFQIIDDKNAAAERKAEMLRAVEGKIRATLDGNQMERLEKNPELLKKLMN